MPSAPFDFTRLDAIDLSLTDVQSPLQKLRQSAFGAQLALVDAVEKALGVAAQSSKGLRQDVANADKERQTIEEKLNGLGQDLKMSNLARLAAEAEVLSKDSEVKKHLATLDNVKFEVKEAQQQLNEERAANDSRTRLLNDQLNVAGDQLAKLRAELDDSRVKLDAKLRPKMAVQDMFAALGHQLSIVNTATPSDSQPFAGQFIVDRLDVELKGGIDLESGFAVVPPQGDQLTPENASTVRFSIRPSTTVRAVDAD